MRDERDRLDLFHKILLYTSLSQRARIVNKAKRGTPKFRRPRTDHCSLSFAFCRAVLFSGDAVHARELIVSGDERTALGRREHAIFVIGRTCIILRRITPDIDRFRKNFTLRLAPLSPTTKSTDRAFHAYAHIPSLKTRYRRFARSQFLRTLFSLREMHNPHCRRKCLTFCLKYDVSIYGL